MTYRHFIPIGTLPIRYITDSDASSVQTSFYENVIDGLNTTMQQFPGCVAIFCHTVDGENWELRGSGVRISDKLILTAGHVPVSRQCPVAVCAATQVPTAPFPVGNLDPSIFVCGIATVATAYPRDYPEAFPDGSLPPNDLARIIHEPVVQDG